MFKCTVLGTFIIILTLVIYYECLSVQEGERAQLEFQYPCNSTNVTLQRSNAAPFYSSSYPDDILQSNKLVTNRKGNDTCSLNLTINPVSRSDTGTYIPIAYKNGRMIIPEKETRVWMGVDYPPGRASCELHRGDIPEGLVKLQCQAPKGTLPGQIVCYQYGTNVSSMTSPHENDRTLDQTLLARVVGPVYCCSSILSEAKDMCECTDWGWDPVHRSLNNIDPCAVVTTANSLTSSTDNRVKYSTHISTSLPLKETKQAPPRRRDFKWHFIIASILCGSLVFIFIIIKIGKKMYQFYS